MKKHSGKIRDVYEVSDDKLVIVTTDRISAFDTVLAKPVPKKGKILNAASLFWFDFTKNIIPNHIISSDLKDMPLYFQKNEFKGRAVLAKRLKMLPFECIVRGYMFGHMWEAYLKNQKFCGHTIEGGYKLAEKLVSPMFTPSTKTQGGHDEYTSFQHMEDTLGMKLADKIRNKSLALYDACYRHAYGKGLIIADTKFEFGLDRGGNLILADEIFTPDSSRFWSLADYHEGISPKSYDKQFIREWLQNNKINGKMQFDNVPDDILQKTSDIYAENLRRLTQ